MDAIERINPSTRNELPEAMTALPEESIDAATALDRVIELQVPRAIESPRLARDLALRIEGDQ